MAEGRTLRVVDGCSLPSEYREALRPGEATKDIAGRPIELPRYFFEIESWEAALETPFSPHFRAFEFLDTDLREDLALQTFPRYLPCAVAAFAAALESFRAAVGAPVRIAANGGYRSPGHALSVPGSPHMWGAAADIYRIGGDYLDDLDRIRRFAGVAEDAMAGVWVRQVGDQPGQSFDHLHLDMGYLTLMPRAGHLEGGS